MSPTMFIRHRLRHHPSFQDWAAGAEGSAVVVVVVPTPVLFAADGVHDIDSGSGAALSLPYRRIRHDNAGNAASHGVGSGCCYTGFASNAGEDLLSCRIPSCKTGI